MSTTSKVFWFFAAWAMLSVVLNLTGHVPSQKPVEEPVVDMSREAQCARGEFKYIIVLYYDGRPIEKAYFRCDNDALVSASKM